MDGDLPGRGLDEILADLRVLRERGLARLTHTDVAHLRRAAADSTAPSAAEGGPGAVEALLRAAVANMGEGTLGSAAVHTFGLNRGGKDRPPSDRRRAAAAIYGVSVERFRKHHERIVLGQVAEEILKLCRRPRAQPGEEWTVAEFSRPIPVAARANGAWVQVAVHAEPVEVVRDIDVIVVPQNVYMEMPQAFKSSISAAVRRRGARRRPDGEMVADLIHEELAAWMRRNGRAGLPVAPGTVAATSAGEMVRQGVRRIYHAAVTSPHAGTNEYDVEPAAVAQTIRNVFAVARAERHCFDPPLISLGFPLLGAGRGGLNPATSLAWIWASLESEIREDGTWEIHFLTRGRSTADLVIARIAELSAAGGDLRPGL